MDNKERELAIKLDELEADNKVLRLQIARMQQGKPAINVKDKRIDHLIRIIEKMVERDTNFMEAYRDD